jgi:hypothetical protein
VKDYSHVRSRHLTQLLDVRIWIGILLTHAAVVAPESCRAQELLSLPPTVEMRALPSGLQVSRFR